MRGLLTLLATLAIGHAASAQSIGTFALTGEMTTARSQHTATRLTDGRVLIAGGSGDNSAELYDPSTGKFVATGRMTDVRRIHSATLLADGRVLIAGGWALTSAEIYDPTTDTFTATGSLLEEQGGHSATLLRDGKVLIAGGERQARPWPTAARAEIYDPLTGNFSFAASYAPSAGEYPAGGPIWPTASVLPDGRVLIVAENPPELYDPIGGTFSLTGAMAENAYRYGMEWHAATALRDGTVLITGGNDDITCGGFAAAEIYDPSSNTFIPVGPMTVPRDIHGSTLLSDGTVLITGGGDGWCGMPTLDSAELYDPATRSFVLAGHMAQSRTAHTATLLNDGTVLIAGGTTYWPASVATRAELYVPPQARTGRTRTHR